MAIVVDFYQSIIFVTSPTDSVTVQQLIEGIRSAEDTPEGMSFGEEVAKLTDAYADAEGKVDVGGGFLNPTTVTLADTWYVEFWDGVLLGTVSGGNLVGGLGSRPVRATVGSADTALQLGAERGIEVSAAGDPATIADAVWDEFTSDHVAVGTYGAEIATKSDLSASTSTDQSPALSGTVEEGTLNSGTYASTSTRDNTYWEIQEDDSTGIIVETTYNLPSADNRAGVVTTFGRYVGVPSGTHHIDLWAYNYESISWELLREEYLPGGMTSDAEYEHEYYERHIDRTNNNEVKIRLIHHTTTYNASHIMYLDYMDVSSINVTTAAAIADAVWDEALVDHVSADTFGVFIQTKLLTLAKWIGLK